MVFHRLKDVMLSAAKHLNRRARVVQDGQAVDEDKYRTAPETTVSLHSFLPDRFGAGRRSFAALRMTISSFDMTTTGRKL